MTDIRYVKDVGTFLTRNAGDSTDSTGAAQLLLGARLHVDESTSVNGWVPATSMRDENGNVRTGFVELRRLSDKQQLKIFYVDVGQEDLARQISVDPSTLARWEQGKGRPLKKHLQRLNVFLDLILFV